MASSIDLSGQIAIVTGGSRGIGGAIALGLARSGADVTIADLPQTSRGQPPRPSPSSKRRAAAARPLTWMSPTPTKSEMPSPKPLLTKAASTSWSTTPGSSIRGSALDLTPEQWDRLHNVNLRGVFFGCQAAAREMMKTGGGRIVNTASELAFVVPRSHISATYIASKHGVVGLTKSLAVEWAQHGIRVNAISPGPTNTDMMADTVATTPNAYATLR